MAGEPPADSRATLATSVPAPAGPVEQFLLPLVETVRADGPPAVRLLVGSRRGTHLGPLLECAAASPESVIDLDDVPAGQLRADLEQHLAHLLAELPAYRAAARRPVREALARSAAADLRQEPPAGHGWGAFLVARVYARALESLDTPSDVPSATAAARVPRTLPDVLELDLGQRTDGVRPGCSPLPSRRRHQTSAGLALGMRVLSAEARAGPRARGAGPSLAVTMTVRSCWSPRAGLARGGSGRPRLPPAGPRARGWSLVTEDFPGTVELVPARAGMAPQASRDEPAAPPGPRARGYSPRPPTPALPARAWSPRAGMAPPGPPPAGG